MKKIVIIITIQLALLLILVFLIINNRKNIVGKWKSINKDNEYYYIFNNDKTCSYEMTVARLDCTYEDDDTKLTILYNGNEKPSTFNYRFEKKILVIEDETGKEYKFIKEK